MMLTRGCRRTGSIPDVPISQVYVHPSRARMRKAVEAVAVKRLAEGRKRQP